MVESPWASRGATTSGTCHQHATPLRFRQRQRAAPRNDLPSGATQQPEARGLRVRPRLVALQRQRGRQQPNGTTENRGHGQRQGSSHVNLTGTAQRWT